MDTQQFWAMIQSANEQSQGNEIRLLDALTTALSAFSEDDIRAFGAIKHELSSEIATDELLAELHKIFKFVSDDSFDYFVSWVVGQGQAVYERVLRNPLEVAQIVNQDEHFPPGLEVLDYVPNDAYKKRTGKDDFYDFDLSNIDWKGNA